MDVSVGGYTGSPSGPTGTIGGEPTGVGAPCQARPRSVWAVAANSLSAAVIEVAVWRQRLIVKANATVQMLTVANPNTNRISCCRLVIFSLLHEPYPFMSISLMSILP